MSYHRFDYKAVSQYRTLIFIHESFRNNNKKGKQPSLYLQVLYVMLLPCHTIQNCKKNYDYSNIDVF